MNNSADRQFEFALESLFDQKVEENRTTRRFWPAISDRLGKQVSRRPWEYVMDALKVPGLSIKPQYIYTTAGALVVAVAVLLFVLLLNTDDGAGGDSVPADSQEQPAPDDSGIGVAPIPTSIPAPTVAPRPTATPASSPTANASDPGGSASFDPEAEANLIRARYRQQWDAFAVRDWDAYRSFCLPIHRETSNSDLDTFYSLMLAANGQTPEGFRTVALDIAVMTPLDALVQFQHMEFAEEAIEAQSLLWTKVDGQWYSSVCDGGG